MYQSSFRWSEVRSGCIQTWQRQAGIRLPSYTGSDLPKMATVKKGFVAVLKVSAVKVKNIPYNNKKIKFLFAIVKYLLVSSLNLSKWMFKLLSKFIERVKDWDPAN